MHVYFRYLDGFCHYYYTFHLIFAELNVVITGANSDGTILLNNYLYCIASVSQDRVIQWTNYQTGNTTYGDSVKMTTLGRQTFECLAVTTSGLQASEIISVDVYQSSDDGWLKTVALLLNISV